MNKNKITRQQIDNFRVHLLKGEKSEATIEKYLRDVRTFWSFAGEKAVTKELVIQYKKCWLRKDMRYGL